MTRGNYSLFSLVTYHLSLATPSYLPAVEQEFGFEDGDLGFGVGELVVEHHLHRLVERNSLHREELVLVGTAVADRLYPAGVEVDDLVRVARRRIDLTERDIRIADGAGLLHQLALAVFERRRAFFQLAGWQFEHDLLIGIAELPHEAEVVVLVERGDAHAARMPDDLAQGVTAVRQRHLVVEHVEHLAVENFFAV